MRVIWSYGILSVEMRLKSTLPRTLQSLSSAGFDRPRLFLDGSRGIQCHEETFGIPVTVRTSPIRAYSNFVLSLTELFCREPNSSHYAMFQDDFICSKNLRLYLEKNVYHICNQSKGYMNLYTFPVNQVIGDLEKPNGGWFVSNQKGKSAVALVFSKQAVIDLLTTRSIIDRMQDLQRGFKNIDGAVITAMTEKGWKEYCHNPSLVQHIGDKSAIGNPTQPQATSFRGEDFDLMTL